MKFRSTKKQNPIGKYRGIWCWRCECGAMGVGPFWTRRPSRKVLKDGYYQHLKSEDHIEMFMELGRNGTRHA